MSETQIEEIKKLRRELKRANAASTAAWERRYKLEAGSSRAKVTTANARWMRAAEHRDRLLARLAELEAAAREERAA